MPSFCLSDKCPIWLLLLGTPIQPLWKHLLLLLLDLPWETQASHGRLGIAFLAVCFLCLHGLDMAS